MWGLYMDAHDAYLAAVTTAWSYVPTKLERTPPRSLVISLHVPVRRFFWMQFCIICQTYLRDQPVFSLLILFPYPLSDCHTFLSPQNVRSAILHPTLCRRHDPRLEMTHKSKYDGLVVGLADRLPFAICVTEIALNPQSHTIQTQSIYYLLS